MFNAVLALAGEREIAAVTVTDVAAIAGVHRTTFYEHAASPVDLLRAALAAELDPLRARLDGATAADAAERMRSVTLGVLDHLDRREAVYRRLDDAAGSAVQAFLGAHFQASARLLVDLGAVTVPTAPGVPVELGRTMALRYVADGHVGALAVWLGTPAPRDRDAVLRTLALVLPPGGRPPSLAA